MRKLLLLTLILLLAACASDPNREFIQGTWVSTDVGGVASGETAMQWQFSRGGFIFQQEILVGDWNVSQGSYRVVESEGDVLMVELYDISGDVFTYNNLPATFRIEIHRESGVITINSRVYERAQ